MLGYFNAIKAKYAARARFFSFEARKRLRAPRRARSAQDQPAPALAVISPNGSVYQEYTGWISQKVMSR